MRCNAPRCAIAAAFQCSRCASAQYCSAGCQRAHWREHEPLCSAAAAAAAAAAPALSASAAASSATALPAAAAASPAALAAAQGGAAAAAAAAPPATAAARAIAAALSAPHPPPCAAAAGHPLYQPGTCPLGNAHCSKNHGPTALPARGSLERACAEGAGAAALAPLLAAAAAAAAPLRGALPLAIAAAGGHVATLRELARLGAPINALDSHGASALYYAAGAGQAAAVAALCALGADARRATPPHASPLLAAAEGGHAAAAAELLRCGADASAHHCDALFYALCADCAPLVRLLCDGYGVAPAALVSASRGGCTPLHSAAEYASPALVRELLARGLAPSAPAPGQGGWRPLHFTASGKSRHTLGVARALLAGGADVNAASDTGSTALYLAAANGLTELVKELLGHGADVGLARYDGISPLMAAQANGHRGTAKALRRAGARSEW